MNKRYVILTAAKNEINYIKKTLNSVISQTHKPSEWVIVSDKSTDGTEELIKKYEKKYKFIKLVALKGESKRDFGSQVHAINKGYKKLEKSNYEFIGNIDADVSFEPAYFENLINKFENNPKIGIAGGTIYEKRKNDSKFKYRKGNSLKNVPHAVQLFRKECFEEIGGYIPLKYGGPDWYAEINAKMHGWIVRSFEDLIVKHHKPTLSGEGFLKGAIRQGKMDYSIGTNPVFELIKCLYRINVYPNIFYPFYRLFGYVTCIIKNEKREATSDAIKYLQNEQISRLKDVAKNIIKIK